MRGVCERCVSRARVSRRAGRSSSRGATPTAGVKVPSVVGQAPALVLQTVVRVATPRSGNNNRGSEIEVRIPARKTVNVRTVSADVEVREVAGVVEAHSVSGNLALAGSPREVIAESRYDAGQHEAARVAAERALQRFPTSALRARSVVRVTSVVLATSAIQDFVKDGARHDYMVSLSGCFTRKWASSSHGDGSVGGAPVCSPCSGMSAKLLTPGAAGAGVQLLAREGEYGRNRINQYTRLLTVPLAFAQGYGEADILNPAAIGRLDGRFDVIVCNHIFTHALRPREDLETLLISARGSP